MRHPRIVLGALGVAAVAAIGGVAAAATAGSSGNDAPSSGSAVHTAAVSVGGKTESVLVDGQGDPLYYYQPDTPTTSMVTGQLAALWPPLNSSGTAESVAGGQLSAVSDSHGSQASYNGHLLYTFVSDHPGSATGEGVQNFFLVTPALAPAPGSAPAPTAPAGSSSGGSYGY